MKKIACLTLLMIATFPRNLLAHPGHGNPSGVNSSLHYLLEPEHSLPVFAGLLLISTAVYFWQNSRSQNR